MLRTHLNSFRPVMREVIEKDWPSSGPRKGTRKVSKNWGKKTKNTFGHLKFLDSFNKMWTFIQTFALKGDPFIVLGPIWLSGGFNSSTTFFSCGIIGNYIFLLRDKYNWTDESRNDPNRAQINFFAIFEFQAYLISIMRCGESNKPMYRKLQEMDSSCLLGSR